MGAMINKVLNTDRSDSVVIEEIIIRGREVPQVENVGVKELVLTPGWYLLWERRQLVHGERVQSPFRSAMAIAALTKNYKLARRKGTVT